MAECLPYALGPFPPISFYSPLYPGSCRRACEGVSRRDKERRQVRGTWGMYSFRGAAGRRSLLVACVGPLFTTIQKWSVHSSAHACTRTHTHVSACACFTQTAERAHTHAHRHCRLGNNLLGIYVRCSVEIERWPRHR